LGCPLKRGTRQANHECTTGRGWVIQEETKELTQGQGGGKRLLKKKDGWRAVVVDDVLERPGWMGSIKKGAKEVAGEESTTRKQNFKRQ